MFTTLPKCNFSLEFQNHTCYHWLSVPGISNIMHCGLLINMPYWYMWCLVKPWFKAQNIHVAPKNKDRFHSYLYSHPSSLVKVFPIDKALCWFYTVVPLRERFRLAHLLSFLMIGQSRPMWIQSITDDIHVNVDIWFG